MDAPITTVDNKRKPVENRAHWDRGVEESAVTELNAERSSHDEIEFSHELLTLPEPRGNALAVEKT